MNREYADFLRDMLENAQYFGINMEVVWQTIQEDLPMLIEALKKA